MKNTFMKLFFGVSFMLFANMGFTQVNINVASAKELEALPGIGAVKAEAIVEFREQYGDFSSVDDLKKVSGISDKTVEKLASSVTTEGES